ncbi:vitamin K epoxide reductase family protein [uncultured Friedmanniella sp.]|uniref:vitamin K epoxide reductase family protein n=1 Tax=uncultured Friedmanniella sp. TaxID=335381 RepID=UPI0035CA0EED
MSPVTDADRTRTRVEPSLVVALVGLAVSAYLTVEHFTSSALLACPEGAVVNCAKVTSSPYSEVAGVPVAVLGLAYFVGMVALLTPAAWQHRRLDLVRLAGVGAGVLSVVYLVWVELFRVNALCLWCTAVHVCTLALLGTVLWRTADADR